MPICTNGDDAIRWREGERLHHLFEERCDRFDSEGGRDTLAVVAADVALTFRDLDERANQVARFLIDRGLRSGDRVGLLFDKDPSTYVAILAVLKINAVYVPLDIGFPKERVAFILQDADVSVIVSFSAFHSKLSEFPVASIYLDAVEEEIDKRSTLRLGDEEKLPPNDQLAYIIYTSGTTGTPKGVAIEHPSICNFVKVAAEVYGFRQGDRCYQGMTIAFDFSVEELWVPLIAGATLVPGKPGTSLVGADLANFLSDNYVTVLCCVPTLLATIERDLPELRILLVSGEACPHNLVLRWQRPGRTILNAYGPTEATVTATLTELCAEKPVTIGRPLPTYAIVILDDRKAEALAPGEIGEIGIAGIGLAAGYLNREDLTRKKFIPDFLNIPNNPSKRIYRTGDLGRVNENGEVEFLGRIDTQVKIRGYRIELAEIESVLMQLPQIAQAVVSTYEPEPGSTELVAYYTRKQGVSTVSRSEIVTALRSRLPVYMVPYYLEELAVIPMSLSSKADRVKLPAPANPRFLAESSNFIAPRTRSEKVLAEALAETLKVECVSVADHFFNDLGAHSLLMARFGYTIRKRLEDSAVSMGDIYRHPTIEQLARHLDAVPVGDTIQRHGRAAHVPSRLSYVSCGALQLLYYVAYGAFVTWLLAIGFDWIDRQAGHTTDAYLRMVVFAAAAFVVLSAIPIGLKWLLIGRWKEEAIPIWSLRYFRFWLVKNLIRSAPMAWFVGTPIYNLYLRLLGARIGRNSVVWTRLLPVCTDLISIGEDTIVRKDSVILGYKAQSNWILTGSVSIGARSFVGEGTILDIDTLMEDDTQLGYSSSLQSGQRVPKERHYHGSPAQETQANYCALEARTCTAMQRARYCVGSLFFLLAVASPLAGTVLGSWLPDLFGYAAKLTFGNQADASVLHLAAQAMASSFVVMVASLLGGVITVALVPRALWLLLKKDRTYPLYGYHYFVYRAISVLSNSRLYNLLCGDSSFIVHYLRAIGYKLNTIRQTGSNFGTNQKHELPFLCDIGSGTMVSDGLSMMNAEMTNSSFALRRIKIGDHNYLGNDVRFPPEGKAGANCLLGTKVLIPIDGHIRENVGLLGSPSFEIPRAVDRDRNVGLIDDEQRSKRILEKNRHNFVTVLLFLGAYWIFLSAALFVEVYISVRDTGLGHAINILLFEGFLAVFAVTFFALVERASLGFGRLEPKIVSIYDAYFWFHERHWKLSESPLMFLFKGTPFKNVISRMLGVKVGRMVFDDGCQFLEKTLIEIGDFTNLNEACVLQGHSLEEAVFKSDRIRIGRGCSLGCAAFVHYGVRLGDDVVLAPDSFLMKGEIVETNAVWQGNPARAITDRPKKERSRAFAPLEAA